MRFLLFAGLVCLTLPSACRRAPTVARDGQLLAEWQGTYGGRFIAPMSATHCPESGVVELIAIRGDTGVGFALYPVDSSRIVTGEFRVFPSETVVPARPAAGVALRWYTGLALAPFEGTAGTVHASVADSLLSGDFEVRMEQTSGTDTLTITGRFVALPIRRMAPGCSQTSRRNLN